MVVYTIRVHMYVHVQQTWLVVAATTLFLWCHYIRSFVALGLVLLQQEVNRFYRVSKHKGENAQKVPYCSATCSQTAFSTFTFSIMICCSVVCTSTELDTSLTACFSSLTEHSMHTLTSLYNIAAINLVNAKCEHVLHCSRAVYLPKSYATKHWIVRCLHCHCLLMYSVFMVGCPDR